DCQMFGKRAEVINKYFHKGDPILVEGRLKFDSWQAQDGSKRSKLRVFIENFEFVGGSGQRGAGPGGGGGQGGGGYGDQGGQGGGGGQGGDQGGYSPGPQPGVDEDIPF
ncbi:MAG: single-stranded DNA-binding protein, partial [Planctomycetes bacterium]|nr:single-stranded DNA-binding protein [Planctomycetota bacterium]